MKNILISGASSIWGGGGAKVFLGRISFNTPCSGEEKDWLILQMNWVVRRSVNFYAQMFAIMGVEICVVSLA